ncbi:MAG: SDR family oxidoreductase [Gemmatimonadota bacterium]|nr:SDR family oxidoreductase [Gemmatimonadota bacterium]
MSGAGGSGTAERGSPTGEPETPAGDELAGRALVTGGAVRVGRAIALALGAAGWRVAVHWRTSQAEARAVVARLEALGPGGTALQADLADPARAEALPGEAAAALGGLDLLVNSAAIFPSHDPLAVPAAEWDRVFAVNLRAPFLCARAAARVMGEAGGAIVNLIDTGWDEAWPSYIPYVATKAGLASVTRGLARALAPRVRVNGVAPGPVLLPADEDTPEGRRAAAARTALGRVGTADDVAQAVLYLASAPYVTGEILRVDGGHHLT